MSDTTYVSGDRSTTGWLGSGHDHPGRPGILPPLKSLPEEARPGIFAPPN